jgi:hypothetical protein
VGPVRKGTPGAASKIAAVAGAERSLRVFFHCGQHFAGLGDRGARLT